MGLFVIKILLFPAIKLTPCCTSENHILTQKNGDYRMNNRVTSEEVANQFAKAIQLLLEWARQEMLIPSQPWEDR